MSRLEDADHHTNIYLSPRPDVDIAKIYNYNFFQMMGLDVTIDTSRYEYIGPVDVTEQPENDIDTSSTLPIPITPDKNANLVDILFGPEQKPNGYTDLPLQFKKENEQATTASGDDGLHGTHKPVERTTSTTFLSKMRDYISSFTRSSEPTTTVSGEDIVIAIPHRKEEEKIQTMDNWRTHLLQPPYSIFCITDTNITYEILEQVMSDLRGQLEYFHDHHVTFRELTMSQVYVINGRFVILDSEHMVPYKNGKYLDLAANVIYQLVGKGVEFLHEIKHTRLYGDMIEIQ